MRQCFLCTYRLLDSCDDVRISTAATDVATHQVANVIGSFELAFPEQSNSGTNLARRAIAALESVVLDKRLLQGVKHAVLSKPFDGRNFRAIFHDREGEA